MKAVCIIAGLLMVVSVPARAQVPTEDIPLRTVIETLGREEGLRFLYRDALVNQVRVPAGIEGLEQLREYLESRGIILDVDPARRVVLVLQRQDGPAPLVRNITGSVVDHETGAPLPFATLYWRTDGALRGSTTSADGSFVIALRDPGPIDITASYVGYRPQSFRVPDSETSLRMNVRLQSEPLLGREVIVTGSLLRSNLDTTWHHLTRPETYAPFGESNLIRSLSLLPAAAVGPAGAEGLILRGSSSDGLAVMLDGMTIYNHSHLFGLFDAFNPDALQTASLYFDVAPASFASAPGGLLAFRTRSGSRNRPRATVGLTNTAGRLTLELPLRPGRSSILLSGRRSYMDVVDWFDNDGVIAAGLNVSREREPLPTGALDRTDRLLRPLDATATFYDVHLRVEDEDDRGNIWSVSGYAGGNTARYDAQRLMREQQGGGLGWLDIETDFFWGSLASSVENTRNLSHRLRLHATTGVSTYRSRFGRDDLEFRRRDGGTVPIVRFVDFFEQSNQLVDGSVGSHLEWLIPQGTSVRVGGVVRLFDVRYEERSAVRPLFELEQRALQLDAFIDGSVLREDEVELHAGIRIQQFGGGSFTRLSPRLRAMAPLTDAVAFGAGYSRTYQFLHRMALVNEGGPSFWIASARDAPPSAADLFSTGIYLRPHPRMAFQAEAYLKHTVNVRDHEIDAPLWRVPDLYEGSPFITDLTSRARGLELMARLRAGAVQFTTSYALASVWYWSSDDETSRYRAPWDRRHQVAAAASWRPLTSLTVDATWIFASGAPNELALMDDDEPAELEPYQRIDAAIRYSPARNLRLTVAAFNLLDRQNTWYRTSVPLATRGPRPSPAGSATLDVYDFGLRPSFEVLLRL